jgi:hypothetical protein
MFKHVMVPALLSLAAAACSTVDKLGSEPHQAAEARAGLVERLHRPL